MKLSTLIRYFVCFIFDKNRKTRSLDFWSIFQTNGWNILFKKGLLLLFDDIRNKSWFFSLFHLWKRSYLASSRTFFWAKRSFTKTFNKKSKATNNQEFVFSEKERRHFNGITEMKNYYWSQFTNLKIDFLTALSRKEILLWNG